jgi:peptidoglycan/xylan/chitin deacetylase (PgdA/CDA1 family)
MDFKKTLFDNPLSLGFSKALSKRIDKNKGGFILAYHQIKLDLFKAHLDAFRPRQVVSLDEIVRRKKEGRSTKGLFAITVDDCYESTLPDLCGYCAEKQIPITFYAPMDFLNGKPMPNMLLKNIIENLPGQKIETSVGISDFKEPEKVQAFYKRMHHSIYVEKENAYIDEMKSILEQLIEKKVITAAQAEKYDKPVSLEFIAEKSKNELLSFQSHSITHQPVVALTPEELEKELIESKEKLNAITNKPVNHFCYPYGGLSNIGTAAQQIVAKHYDSAVTMIKGRLDVAEDLYMLPRIDLYNKDSKGRALLKTIVK